MPQAPSMPVKSLNERLFDAGWRAAVSVGAPAISGGITHGSNGYDYLRVVGIAAAIASAMPVAPAAPVDGMRLGDGEDAPGTLADLIAKAMRGTSGRSTGAEAVIIDADERNQRLSSLLRDLKAHGLQFRHCVEAFGVKRDEDPVTRRAYELHNDEGEIEIDDITVRSGDDACPDGEYVLAWAWVPKD